MNTSLFRVCFIWLDNFLRLTFYMILAQLREIYQTLWVLDRVLKSFNRNLSSLNWLLNICIFKNIFLLGCQISIPMQRVFYILQVLITIDDLLNLIGCLCALTFLVLKNIVLVYVSLWWLIFHILYLLLIIWIVFLFIGYFIYFYQLSSFIPIKI